MMESIMERGASQNPIESDDLRPQPDPGRSRRVAMAVFIALSCVLLVSVFYSASPADSDGQYFTICGFKALTGLPCPGCGLTHSFCAIGKGDLRAGFSFNAIGPPLYLVSMLVWLRFGLVLAGIRRPVEAVDRRVNHLKVVRWFVIALVVFGIVRIVYLLIWQPAGVHGAPLIRLVERVIG
jgi:Protein of unknown function (DUF2752)